MASECRRGRADETRGLARKNHRFSSRGRQDAVVAGRTDLKSAYALAKA